MWFFVENRIPVSKLGWETRHTVKFGLFWGPLFTWDFPNIGSIVKKFCAPEIIRPARRFFMKEAENNPSENLYRCDFAWRIGFRCRICYEKAGEQSNLGFLGDHFSLEIFSNIGSPRKKPARKLVWRCVLWRKSFQTLPRPLILKAITIVSK